MKRIFLFLITFAAVICLQKLVLSQVPSARAELLSQLNRVQVYLDEGNFTQASRILDEVSPVVPPEYEPYAKAIAGNLAFRQGDYTSAIALYHKLLSSGLGGSGNQLTLLNNYTQALLKREQIYQAQAKDDLERHSEFIVAAGKERQQASELLLQAIALVGTSGNPEAEIRAQLNLAKLRPAEVDLSQVEKDILSLPASRTQVELLIELTRLSPDPLPLLQKAVQISQDLKDARSRSWASGALGEYYQKQGDYPLALNLSQQAQWLAQETLDWAGLVQWQGQAARIYRQMGESQKALTVYRQAIHSLQTLRKDLAGNRVSQSLFLDTIQPLLRGYLELLLSQSPSPESLQEAISVLKVNQLAELDNYFGSVCQITPQKTVREQNTAIVYTVMLPQQTYEILELPDGTYSLFGIPTSETVLQQQLLSWRQDLQNPFSKEYQRGSRALYDLLLRPLEGVLASQKIAHLVFVQDGVLRNVPMAALFDNQQKQFLIERFAVSYSLGLGGAIAPVIPKSPLIVGNSQPTPSFPTPLPGVVREAKAIQALLGGTELIDLSFTKERLATRLQNPDYQLLHVASHGKFTGLSEEAIIQTGGGNLSLNEVEQLLRARQSPLTHLTLSACETAQGSRYAVLGLAGVGIRSGIPSVLGTLWFTADEKTADFVLDFYTNWQQGKSLEASLRQSQVRLIRQMAHPKHWADFVLLKS
jgi:CHAT domain-containing protein